MILLSRRHLLATAALLPLLPHLARASTGTARIAEATEGGSLTRNGETLPLTPGTEVQEGDTVLTAPNGLALLILPDETRVNIGPKTAVLAAALASDARLVLTGSVAVSQLTGGERPLTVDTPYARVLQQGGRSFIGESGGKYGVLAQVTGLQVVQDAVTRQLAPGDGVDLAEATPPTEPKPWGQARVAESFALVGLQP